MKEELQSKLVEILGSIQTAAGKAGDFAMSQLPEIAQSYVIYGRVFSSAALIFSICMFAFICWLTYWTYTKVSDGMDEVVWMPHWGVDPRNRRTGERNFLLGGAICRASLVRSQSLAAEGNRGVAAMSTRDLTDEDVAGFLHAHHQRAQETRFAQLEDDWTPCTPLEDVAILLGIFCCCLAAPVAWVIWRLA